MGTRDPIDDFVERACKIFPRLDPEVEGIVDRVCKLAKKFDGNLEHGTAEFDLNKGEYKLLAQLRQHDPDLGMSPGELGESLMLSSGAMTNRLDGLEAAGLVTREPDLEDRRALIVRLTPAGIDKIDQAVNSGIENEIAVMSVLSPAEQKRLNALLRKLVLCFERRPHPVGASARA